jgi:hypothetical protein
MYGIAALVLLHCSGSLGGEVEGMLVGPLLMLSAAVGALAAGLPLWMLPAPLLAASGLAMFYDTGSMRDYMLFVVGALATGEGGLWWEAVALESAVCYNVCVRCVYELFVHATGSLACAAAMRQLMQSRPPHSCFLASHILTCVCPAHLQAAGLCGTTSGSWTLRWMGCS